MSLGRLALRLAAVETLCPYAALANPAAAATAAAAVATNESQIPLLAAPPSGLLPGMSVVDSTSGLWLGTVLSAQASPPAVNLVSQAANPAAAGDSLVASFLFPTLAGANVYDTRLDPVAAPDEWADFLTEVEGSPIAIVYTEEHETEPKSPGDPSPEVETVELVVELMIAARGEVTVQTPDGPSTVGALTAPVTDRQREAILDLLEAQIRNLFDLKSLTGPSQSLFSKIAWEVRHIRSVPQREANGTARIAARTCCWRVKVMHDQWPQPMPPLAGLGEEILGDWRLGAAAMSASGIARLPQPMLTSALGLDPASSGGQLCLALAGMIADPAAAPALREVVLSAQWPRTWPPTFAPPAPAEVAAEDAPADMTGAAILP